MVVNQQEGSCNVTRRRMLRPLVLLQSVDRAMDSLQERWESWLGALELWFRKTGQQESFLSSAVCFYFVFSPLSFFLSPRSLALSLYQTVVQEGISSYLLISFFFPPVFVGRFVLLESAKLQKSTMSGCLRRCSRACVQWEGLAI